MVVTKQRLKGFRRMLPSQFRPSVRVFALLMLLAVLLVPVSPVGASSPVTAVNAGDELKIIHNAYTALVTTLYEQPDSTALLTAAHTAAERELSTSLPLDALSGDAETQFTVFAGNFQALVARTEPVSLPKGQLAHNVIREMAKVVDDPHTYFLDTQAADAERRRIRGDTSIVNFGMIAVNIEGGYYVKHVVDDSPVQRAGLLPGDHVLALDGQPVTWDNRANVLGNPVDGKTYALEVRHAHASADTVLTVQMQRYNRETLAFSVIDHHIGYIRTFAFFEDIPAQLDNALDALDAQGVDSLLIDFRGNGGGTNVEEVVGRFLPEGTVIGRSVGWRNTLDFVAHTAHRPIETRHVVVLVDETSGSASEIAALALHDLKGARIVGRKTAGALGTVRFADLGDTTLLAVTTSAYISVSGARLNKIGVTPDIIVDRSTDDALNGVDPQMDAARDEITRLVAAPVASFASWPRFHTVVPSLF